MGAKIKEDGIRFPASQGADGSLIHAGDEESSGSPGAKAVGDDSGGGKFVICWTKGAAVRRAVVMSPMVTSWGEPTGSK